MMNSPDAMIRVPRVDKPPAEAVRAANNLMYRKPSAITVHARGYAHLFEADPENRAPYTRWTKTDCRRGRSDVDHWQLTDAQGGTMTAPFDADAEYSERDDIRTLAETARRQLAAMSVVELAKRLDAIEIIAAEGR